MQSKFFLIPLETIAVIATPAFAKVYLTVEQAQAIIFPGAKFKSLTLTLTDEQADQIQEISGVGILSKQLHIWRVSTGGWFIADEVVGKHEYIPFALGLNDSGDVVGVEILEYRESYGGEVRDPKWLSQFVGKGPGAKLRDGGNIRNISGATLSSKHVTDGISRLLATYEVVLSQRGPFGTSR